jgi:hypothetical protein
MAEHLAACPAHPALERALAIEEVVTIALGSLAPGTLTLLRVHQTTGCRPQPLTAEEAVASMRKEMAARAARARAPLRGGLPPESVGYRFETPPPAPGPPQVPRRILVPVDPLLTTSAGWNLFPPGEQLMDGPAPKDLVLFGERIVRAGEMITREELRRRVARLDERPEVKAAFARARLTAADLQRPAPPPARG